MRVCVCGGGGVPSCRSTLGLGRHSSADTCLRRPARGMDPTEPQACRRGRQADGRASFTSHTLRSLSSALQLLMTWSQLAASQSDVTSCSNEQKRPGESAVRARERSRQGNKTKIGSICKAKEASASTESTRCHARAAFCSCAVHKTAPRPSVRERVFLRVIF